MKQHIFKFCLFLCIGTLVLGAKAHAQAQYNVRFNAQELNAARDGIFSVQDDTSLFTALDANLEIQGLRLAATASWHKQGEDNGADLRFSEAFYDFALGDWLVSAGKKKLDWDVGYGFRPLDMFSPTDSLAIYNAVPPGAMMLVGDYFTDSGNISLLCNETRSDYLLRGVKVAASFGCGGRYYHYFDGFEAQLVAHYDEKLGGRVGGSAQTVIGESLELHASLLWQQNYRSPGFDMLAIGRHSFMPEVDTLWQKGALQGLWGVNYSLASGITLIAEYWHDGRAPSDSQWRDVIRASKQAVQNDHQRILRGHFATQNLFRDNLMLHVRTSNEVWRPQLSWLVNPNDNSMFIDGRLCYHGLSQSQLCAGLRQYAGGRESIYEQLSYRTSWYFEVEVKL